MSQDEVKAQPASNFKGNLPSQLGNAYSTALKVATRPIVTIIFAAVIAQVVVEGIDAPDWFIAMAGIVILEWWGERTITRLKEKK